MAAYIKFDGIDGECIEKDHDKWTELHSFTGAIHKSGVGASGSSRNAGSAIFEDMNITKTIDTSTPKLLKSMAHGERIKKVEIHVCTTTKKGQQPYLKYELSDCMISNYQIAGTGQDRANESMSLNFTKIKESYFATKPDGELGPVNEFGWDVDKDEDL